MNKLVFAGLIILSVSICYSANQFRPARYELVAGALGTTYLYDRYSGETWRTFRIGDPWEEVLYGPKDK